MNTKQFLKGAMLAAVTLSGMTAFYSCSQDAGETPGDNERVAVQFTTQVGGSETTAQTAAPQTRTTAGGTAWVAGDQVGVFMLTATGTLPTDIVGGEATGANNKPYTASAAGTPSSLVPSDAANTIYYPQAGHVDFIAYYPYRATPVTDPYLYKVNVAVQNTAAAQATVDVLYSNNVTDKAGSKTDPVALAFDHALAKLVINVKNDTGMSNAYFSAMGISLNGFPTTADLALADGATFTNPGGTITPITPLKWTTASDAQFVATCEAIVIPQSNGSGRTVAFSASGETYTWIINDGVAFVQGKTHTYDITISQTGITVSSPAITPWTGTGGTPQSSTAEVFAVKIKAGTFMMGSSDGSGIPTDLNPAPAETNRGIVENRHWVKLTKDFYMSRYLITNTQYAAFLNAKSIGSDGKGQVIVDGTPVTQVLIYSHPWGVQHDATGWKPGPGKENHPVVMVPWYGAKAFADWVGGALPTEAQWEYACRAGTTTAYSYGNTVDADYMWYSVNSSGSIQPVGQKKPNPWGLFDMHGNVWEWCLDKRNVGDNYPTADSEPLAILDPLGASGGSRVLRGGSWYDSAQGCRSACRDFYDPDSAGSFCGFRVVFSL